MKRPFLSPWLFAIALGACAPAREVTLNHLRSLPDMTEQAYATTANVFMIVDARGLAIPDPDTHNKAETEEHGGAVEALNLARLVSSDLADAQGRVSAYRITDGKLNEADFLDAIRPTTVLRLSGGRVAYAAEKTGTKDVTTTDKNGKKQTRVAESWKYGYSASLDMELVGHPSGAAILKKTISTKAETSCSDCTEKADPTVIGKLSDLLLSGLAAEVTHAARPVEVLRAVRPVLFQENAPLSKQASDAALKNDWAAARTAWQARLAEDPTDWKAAFGLGVEAERSDRFDEARTWYERARDMAAQSSEAKKIDFGAIIAAAHADRPLPPLGPSTDTWFGKRIAVLPFSDEVVSLNGPDFLRRSVNEFLTRSGYRTIPLEDIDAVLKEHGFSDGGQLTAVKNTDLAAWLKADRLLFGHVEDFDDKNIGIYRKRGVTAELKIWDAGAKDFIWMSRRRTSTKIFSDNPGAEFLGGLLETWFERDKGTPLVEEVTRFTVLNLETLPLRCLPLETTGASRK